MTVCVERYRDLATMICIVRRQKICANVKLAWHHDAVPSVKLRLGELGDTHFGVRYIFAGDVSSILLVFIGKEFLAVQAKRTVIRKNPRRIYSCERARHEVLQSLENELGELASQDGGRGSRLQQELKCVWKRTFAYGSHLSLTTAVIKTYCVVIWTSPCLPFVSLPYFHTRNQTRSETSNVRDSWR